MKALESLLNRNDLGFIHAPEREILWRESLDRAQQLEKLFDRLVVFGIGGSSLGALALLETIPTQKPVLFFENVDAKDFWDRMNTLGDLRRTHFVAISKSGNTMETLSQVSFVLQWLTQNKIDFKKHFTVISEKKQNPLTQWAGKCDIPVLELPADIGGRFSVLTPVGLFPAAFAGIDLDLIRKGARRAMKDKPTIEQLLQFSLKGFTEQKAVTLFWIYSNKLRSFGFWLQQLWAESLAKKLDRNGNRGPYVSTPIPLLGANDQHSVLQQIVEGEKDKNCLFLRVEESESFGPLLETTPFQGMDYLVEKNMGTLLKAEADATRSVLDQVGVPCFTLTVDRLDAETMGYLFMLFELLIGALGEALNINAFDQPGVELGKRLARESLSKN